MSRRSTGAAFALLAVALLTMGSVAGLYMMEPPERRTFEFEDSDGGGGGGGYTEPAWAGGSWSMESSGMDVTMGYDPMTKTRGPELIQNGTGDEVESAAQELVEYQIGWTSGDIWVNVKTQKNASPADQSPHLASIRLLPGEGWFLPIVRDSGDGSGEILPTKWDPAWNETLEVKVTSEVLNTGALLSSPTCPSTSLWPGAQNGWVSAIAPEPSDSALKIVPFANKQDTENRKAENVWDGFYRNEMLQVDVHGPSFDNWECRYSVSFRWNLMFSFETFQFPPGTPDPDNIDPNILHFDEYERNATLEIVKGDETNYVEPELRESPAPIALKMLYMPVLALNWVCDFHNLVPCVEDLLKDTPTSGWSTFVGSPPDAQGLVLMATQTIDGVPTAVVHKVDGNRVLLSESLVYEWANDTLGESSFV